MKRKDILLLLGISCIAIIGWIIFEVYHATIASTINTSLTGEILPIKPEFDQQVINNTKNRKQITPIFTIQTASQSSSVTVLSPTPSLTINKTSSQSATSL